MDAAVVPYDASMVYCITVYISHNNKIAATKIIIIIYYDYIWLFRHGILDAFFVVKASCGGRWWIPSSNWIIDEEANGVIDFVSIIIVIIIIIIIIIVFVV